MDSEVNGPPGLVRAGGIFSFFYWVLGTPIARGDDEWEAEFFSEFFYGAHEVVVNTYFATVLAGQFFFGEILHLSMLFPCQDSTNLLGSSSFVLTYLRLLIARGYVDEIGQASREGWAAWW